MPYIITGTVTFTNQTQRDAARTRVDSAVAGYTFTTYTSTFTPGINNSGTTVITFSIRDGDDGETARALGQAILNALTASNRHTSGYISVNRV